MIQHFMTQNEAQELENAFNMLDKDGSGTVNFVEMCEVLFPNLPDSTYKEMLEYVTNDEKKNRKHRVVQLKDHQIEEIKQDESKSIKTRLAELKELLDSNLISEKEYDEKRLELIKQI